MIIKRYERVSVLSEAVVEHGNTVYISGIMAKDLSQDIKGQTREVLAEIDRRLALCGSDKSKLLQVQIWVADMRDRPAMNEVWADWVDGANLPTRACVQATLAEPRGLLEIKVIAAK